MTFIMGEIIIVGDITEEAIMKLIVGIVMEEGMGIMEQELQG